MPLLIEGRIINLRTLMISDAYSIYENARDREISKYTRLPYPYRLKHAYDFISLCQENYKKKAGYELGIELKKAGKIIGIISLIHVDNTRRTAGVGYWLGKQYWRRGITKEALTLILDYGFNTLKLARIYAKVLCSNLPSVILLQHAGFKYEGRIRRSFLGTETGLTN
jgi:RimJ/RimL family protein N-acetyltransferase